ncbi:MAG: hypothetical protein HY360_07595 [Verrucomicrobia bacterium]|nr:hypothetical protein [Verrucomicrobiota bacterium]
MARHELIEALLALLHQRREAAPAEKPELQRRLDELLNQAVQGRPQSKAEVLQALQHYKFPAYLAQKKKAQAQRLAAGLRKN